MTEEETLIEAVESLIESLAEYEKDLVKALPYEELDSLSWFYQDDISEVTTAIQKLKHKLWEQSLLNQ